MFFGKKNCQGQAVKRHGDEAAEQSNNETKVRTGINAGILACAMMAVFSTSGVQAARVAPYFYGWSFSSGGQSGSYAVSGLMDAKSKAGLDDAILAFGIGGSCTINDAGFPMSNPDFVTDVKNFTSQGGNLTISFGGNSGPFLETGCTSAQQMADTIQGLIDKFGAKSIDFDIESPPIYPDASDQYGAIRNGAIKILQQKNSALKVSFTLPVLTTGLTDDGKTILNNAIKDGVKLYTVNIMAMDYGGANSDMGQAAIDALTATFGNLQDMHFKDPQGKDLSDSAIWGMLGVTPMIGENDSAGETFTVADAAKLTNFALTKNIGLISYWAFQRDQANASGGKATSSLVTQANFDFYKAFKGGEVNSVTTNIYLSSSSGGASSSGSSSSYASSSWNGSGNGSQCPVWQEGKNYKVGDVVSYAGSTYQALQAHTSWAGTHWQPDVTPTLWAKARSCSSSGGSSSGSQNGGGCYEWEEGYTYPVGTVVTFHGATYTAQIAHTAWKGAGWNPVAAPALWTAGGSCSSSSSSSGSSSGSSSNSSSGSSSGSSSNSSSGSSSGSSSNSSSGSSSGSSSNSSSGSASCSGTAPWGDTDVQTAKDKIVQNLTDIKQAAASNGIDWHDLAAIIMQEGRGFTAEQMRAAGGLAQIGSTEITALKNGQNPVDGSAVAPHPELLAGSDTDYTSPHNQIYGAAAYLGVLKTYAGGDMNKAMNIYNKGGNISAGLGDPAYMCNHAQALQLLASFNLS